MKKMCLLSLVLAGFCFAQNPKEIEMWADNYNNKVKYLNNGQYENVFGNPYFNQDFVHVEIEGMDNVAEKLRYNALSDQMEFMKDNQMINLNPMENKLITFNLITKAKFKFINHNFTDGATNGYVQVLVNGSEFKLLKRNVKFLKNNSLNTQIKQRDTSFEIDEKPVEYLLEVDGNFYKLPKNKKDFIKKIQSSNPEYYQLLENYNPKSERDLIQLIEKINK